MLHRHPKAILQETPNRYFHARVATPLSGSDDHLFSWNDGWVPALSPTVLRKGGFRFMFFSLEEARMHVHVQHERGEAKVWLEPSIEVAEVYGLSSRQIGAALRLIREHDDEIRTAWKKHFSN